MSENDQKNFSADIPEDAIQEALESVDRKEEAPAEEETVVEVEVEPAGEEADAGSGLAQELKKARAEAKEAKERMLRVAADADNTRKRAIKERDEAIKFGQEGLMRDLLTALDNLERTLDHIPEDNDDQVVSGLRQGLSMVLKQFQDTLARYNLIGFSSVGEMFDPARHEALSKKETDQSPPGTVLEEMHRGYMLHDRLLRAALVIVACEPGECAVDDEPDEAPEKESNDAPEGNADAEPTEEQTDEET
jgi:molecular chaperone GrpE